MSILVKNLTKAYGRQHAIQVISFEAHRGEILGFLGPNGAGKTTTMKIITCFMPPSSGTVEVEGMDTMARSLDVRKLVGYLPEMNPLYLDMAVDEYLEYSASLHGLRGANATTRIAEMVDECGLEQVKRRDIGELSKGFRQRVGLAQAMVHDPPILILDEPTSGLDPNQIVEIRKLIRRLGAAKTVVLSTHILSEVQATCDRVIIINDGKLVADGTPEKLQRDFQGTDRLTLEIKADANPQTAIAPALRTIEQVLEVSLLATEGLVSRFEVHTAAGSDARESVFRRAVAEGWVILELRRQTTSLEDVFHKLTTA